jgi:hypothetical protein
MPQYNSRLLMTGSIRTKCKGGKTWGILQKGIGETLPAMSRLNKKCFFWEKSSGLKAGFADKSVTSIK